MTFNDEEPPLPPPAPKDEYSEAGSLVDQSTMFENNDDSHHSKRASHEANLDLVHAKQEDAAVWKLRLLTTLALVCATVAVCVTVVLVQKGNEKESFETAFRQMGGQLVSKFEKTVEDRVAIVAKFATEITTEQRNLGNQSKWPFFTPESWEIRAGQTAQLAELHSLFLLPRVPNASKAAWEEYAQYNQHWIEEGLREQGEPEPIEHNPIAPFIYVMREGRPTPMNVSEWDQYFPMWVQFPAAKRVFAPLNIYGNNDEGFLMIDNVLQNHKPSFPRSIDYWEEEDREEDFVYRLIKTQSPEYEGDPICTTYYPVYGDIHSTTSEAEEVVAVMLGGIMWKTYFESILPDGTLPLVVVLENQCQQNYTYSVGGNHAKFIDHGDWHDSKFDYVELGTSVHGLLGYEEGESIHEGNCAYSIRVYPSDEFEQSFYTNQPKLYALALAGVFVVTSLVFLLYDYMVEQRQKAVMKAALQSGKLVSSLFPEDVRKRLYEEEEAKRQKQRGWKQTPEQQPQQQPHAIATLYPETTIFFADLAGFTKWSSSRTPVEVFDLLEKVYGEFDRMAKRYKVFKVETIGDCYVAVTGLPEAQPDHAVLMCKFARSCMAKFLTVTADVAGTLGEDTKDLEMRVGMHSGRVTAGVLRGEKSRFQLFGDSVNTASRMESNGVKGRIQVSENTAECLRSAGKGHWLTPREDKIVAKGKGEMQTYWVQVIGSGAATTSVSSLPSDASSRRNIDPLSRGNNNAPEQYQNNHAC